MMQAYVQLAPWLVPGSNIHVWDSGSNLQDEVRMSDMMVHSGWLYVVWKLIGHLSLKVLATSMQQFGTD